MNHTLDISFVMIIKYESTGAGARIRASQKPSMEKARKTMKRTHRLLSMVLCAGLLIAPVSGISEEATNEIPRATGSTIEKADLLKEDKLFDITEYGAVSEGDPVANTEAINAAIEAAAEAGGGTVVVPEGDFKTYTIRLQSGVNVRIDEGGIIRAARTDMYNRSGEQTMEGEGGNYDEPEVNLYAGLQDHGHTYFANSLFYAADMKDIMIYGEGLIDGSYMDDSGTLINVLSGSDPSNPENRTDRGHNGTWYGNKAIALVRCENVVLDGIRILNGGHFAIIAEGVNNMTVDGLIVDTNRDAYNIDCTQNVTVRNSHFNSLTDDAIVLKASYGAGIFMPTKNVLIEDCVVSGYDAGSVIAGTYTTDKIVATDACGPTARIKFGTESTCGFDTVTITRVKFERSRGFCLEAVDGSDLTNVVLTDCEMDNVSSSPIFIRVGDRARYPVTGHTTEQAINAQNDVRLDNSGWVLPNTEEYQTYPVARYSPSYNKTLSVSVDGVSSFNVVDPADPARVNNANVAEVDGKYYLYQWDEEQQLYVPDLDQEVAQEDLVYYANATAAENIASVRNIEISNVTINNVDPRYPILLAGLVDSRIENVILRDIDVTYRGGLSLTEATEQRQVGTYWVYTQSGSAPSVQSVPWLVNTFFSKTESLLPRVSWDRETASWVDDPYNVPEMVAEYPEPSILGILPAYAMYARHVDGLTLENVNFSYIVEDTRPAIVLDDVANAAFASVSAMMADGVNAVVLVDNNYKRSTGNEYVPNEPYFATTNENIELGGLSSETVTVDAPAPGTPADSLYPDMRLPIPENGYTFDVATEDYELPLTVHRPYFEHIGDQSVAVGETLTLTVSARNPANGGRTTLEQPEAVIEALDEGLVYGAQNLPEGASFDAETHTLTFTPAAAGEYEITFTLDDGVIPVEETVTITVQ